MVAATGYSGQCRLQVAGLIAARVVEGQLGKLGPLPARSAAAWCLGCSAARHGR
jgi:hypothetical protein